VTDWLKPPAVPSPPLAPDDDEVLRDEMKPPPAPSASGGDGTASDRPSSGGSGEGTEKTSDAGDDDQTDRPRDAPGRGDER
jgi:hypothetical protein